MNIVLNFHEVHSKEWFEKTIKLIGKFFTYIDIKEIEKYFYDKKKVIKKCLITFDDGNVSFYKNAFPVLERNNIPATIFVSPRIIIENKNFWFQDLREIIKLIDENKIKNYIYRTNKPYYKDLEKLDLFSLFKTMKIKDIKDTIELVKKKYKIKINKKFNLTKDQLLELKNNKLITVGAHTINHPILMNENYDTASYEITQSIKEIKKLIGEDIFYFAYPNGKYGIDFDEREIKILKENGIKMSFTTYENYITLRTKPYNIPRCGFSRGNKYFILCKLFMLPFISKLKKNKRINKNDQRIISA